MNEELEIKLTGEQVTAHTSMYSSTWHTHTHTATDITLRSTHKRQMPQLSYVRIFDPREAMASHFVFVRCSCSQSDSSCADSNVVTRPSTTITHSCIHIITQVSLKPCLFYLFVLDCSVWMYGVRSETKGEPVLIFWHLITCLHISSIELGKYWTLQWIHCVPERHSNYYWIRLLLFYAETEKKERGGWNRGRPAGRSYFIFSFQRTFSS